MKRVRCPCGKMLGLPDGRSKFRCPACKSILRVEGSQRPNAAPVPQHVLAAPEEDPDAYDVVQDPEPATSTRETAATALPPAGWVPNQAVVAADSKRVRAHAMPVLASYGTAESAVTADEFPGPFLDEHALFYPFLHPTWACWIGLSFVTALALAAVGTSLFFLTVIMAFGAFASLFSYATMLIACVALVGYIVTTVENVFEETANGANRLARLPGLSFADNLPPFMRMAGALICTLFIAGSIVYLLRNHLGEWETEHWQVNPMVILKMMLIFDVVAWAVFPVFVISNSVEQSFWPIWALPETMRRIVKCARYYVLFLVVSAVANIAINILLAVLSVIHFSLWLIAVGPLLAMYLLYYAHWLGRVARQMIAADD